MLFSGKVECALSGSYVDTLLKVMGKAASGMPIVVIQFAKVKMFRCMSVSVCLFDSGVWCLLRDLG